MRFLPSAILVIFFMLALAGCPQPTPETSDPPSGGAPAEYEEEYIPPADPTEGLENGDAELGREYFLGSDRGKCLDCHTLNGEGNNREFDGPLWALDDTALRRDAEWLAVYLDNPRNLRPEVARMPPFRGDSGGARLPDIVAYLMTLRTEVDHPDSPYTKPAGEPDPNFDGIGDYTGHGGGH